MSRLKSARRRAPHILSGEFGERPVASESHTRSWIFFESFHPFNLFGVSALIPCETHASPSKKSFPAVASHYVLPDPAHQLALAIEIPNIETLNSMLTI